MRRIPELDGLRGFAILLVLIWHYLLNSVSVVPGTALSEILALGRLSWSGVDLFFVLSGFLIGGILIDARESTNYFATFYARRFYRIIPLYVLLLTGAVIFSRFVHSGWLFGDLLPWWSYATFTQNLQMFHGFGGNWLAATWSLAIEEQFYLTLPLVIRYVKPKSLPKVLITVVVLSVVVRCAAFYVYGRMAAYVLMPCRADSLILGVLLAARTKLNERCVVLACLALLASLGFMTLRGWSAGSVQMSTFGYTLIALFYSSLLWLVLHGRFSKVFGMRWLRELGTMAYAVYLLHLPVLGLAHYTFFRSFRSQPKITTFAEASVSLLALGVTFGLARISWLYVERPLLERGHRFRFRWKPAP